MTLLSGWSKAFQEMIARHANKLADVRLRYGEKKGNDMIEWAKTKWEATKHSFWFWLDEAHRRIDSGRNLD